MNVGIVTTWFERGAAYVSRAYMESLSGQHGVFIYARGNEKYAINDPKWDREFVTWGKQIVDQPPTFIDWIDFQGWVSLNKLDIILFNEQVSWDIILKCQKLDLLIGAYVDYYTAETVPFFALYDFLLCNTKRHYSVFENHPQAIYIPWGTDCRIFRPQVGSADAGVITFFHSAGMGGIGMRKGTDILVKSFQKVSGNVKLIIHSQIELEKYEGIVSLVKEDPKIEFLNTTVGSPGLYHLGDVYVYPTRLEGIGLSIAEALACGLPVITTNCPPMNEFVDNNINGRLVEVDHFQQRADKYYWPESICSESALTEAMQYYVDNSLELDRHQKNARNWALNRLDWSKNSSELSQSFSKITHKRQAKHVLVQAVKKHERKIQAEAKIRAAIRYYESCEYAKFRRCLFAGLWYHPKYICDRSVLFLMPDAIIGKYSASFIKSGLKQMVRKDFNGNH